MKKFIFFFAVITLLGCQSSTPVSYYFLFIEEEEGVEPYQTRVFVTKDFLRFDDGEQSETYILLNRQTRRIYSVNHERTTVMTVDPKQADVSEPFELKHTVNVIDDVQDAPKVAGQAPEHRRYVTNGQTCLDVVSVKKLMLFLHETNK